MVREAARLADRWKKSNSEAEKRRDRAQDFARKLAVQLGLADPGVRAILGFGSTFEPWRQYRQDSDIDLALCGGDWGFLWSLIPQSEFLVSLIELDLQPVAFAEQVKTQGVLLYEKQ
ncbi:MAG: hypothetical protein A2Z96_07930 [Spirochaetes bacterium GWB1_48_6]|nr:MAG: hypothetical protein A2Z96_07930 [Spirochaetes bacterium GWB1_48_6]